MLYDIVNSFTIACHSILGVVNIIVFPNKFYYYYYY